jgi:hypothetical protein
VTVARGGKTVYGAAVGILMLETRFPRVPGDVGNAGTWPFPVLYKVVPGASPNQVVRRNAEGLLDGFVAAARELVAAGADGVSSNCGFLALFQRELADACKVPVAVSSLMQVPLVASLLPAGRQVGIITIYRANLTARHLACAGVAPDTPIEGTEEGVEFSRAILDDELALDVARSREDLLAAGRRLKDRVPALGAVVLECTNMPPYAADLAEDLELPVFDYYSFLTWFQAGLRPRRFS